MNTILVWREKVQKLYADYSLYITIMARLLLGGLVFGLINSKIGYMKSVSSIVCTAGLTVVCAFLPVIVMVLAAAGLVLGLVGNIVLSVDLSLVSLIVGTALAIGFGLLAEILFLSVDYTRTEYVEFEDDEYHYFVKAVPKIGVAVPEKNVKQITRRQEEAEDGRRTKRKSARQEEELGESDMTLEEHTDALLLTRSLSKELGLDDPQGK